MQFELAMGVGTTVVTSLSFIIVFILRSEALIQNVDHFSAEVYDEQRKSSLRHYEKC